MLSPLVHAHTGNEVSTAGIHLPGYEHYSENIEPPEFHVITHNCAEEYSIISVSTGINNKQTTDTTPPYALSADNFSLIPVHLDTRIKAKQPDHTPDSTLHYLSLPPRAPPFTNTVLAKD